MRIFDSREVTATTKFAMLEDEPDWMHPEPPRERLYLQTRTRPHQAFGHSVNPVFKCVNSMRERPLIIRI